MKPRWRDPFWVADLIPYVLVAAIFLGVIWALV